MYLIANISTTTLPLPPAAGFGEHFRKSHASPPVSRLMLLLVGELAAFFIYVTLM
jgi:hypothetical protein